MTDDQLHDELERRSRSATHSADWARHDLLPIVNAAIDTRPQRVATSRGPALAGLAAAVAIVVVLVVAMPRLGPGNGSPPPTRPAPPSTIAAIGTAEFATRLATGELNGQTLLIVGEVITEIRFGPVCPTSQDSLCYVGTLAGSTIDLHARPIPTVRGEGNSIPVGASSWDSWRLRAAPTGIARTMAVAVDSDRVVELLGYDPPDEIASALSEIPYVDFDGLSPDEIRVVPGWLAGIDAPLPCPERPSDQEITSLPGRYCGDSSWLTPEKVRFYPLAFYAPRGSLQVQSGAYMQFAENPVLIEGSAEPRAGAYVIARRLEGRGCPNGQPPCWQWEVVGRLTLIGDGDVAVPLPSPAAMYCGPVRPMAQTYFPTVIDQAGVVESCEIWPTEFAFDGSIFVANVEGDLSTLQVEWSSNPCDLASTFTFSRTETGYSLQGRRPDVGCDEPLVRHAIRIHLRQPIDANSISAALAELGPPVTPTPTQTPVSRVIECPVDPTSGEPDLAPQVSLSDRTGLFGDCSAFAGTPEFMIVDWSKPTVRNSGTSQLEVIWRGTVCDHQADVLVSGDQGAVTIEVHLADEYTSCDNPSAGYLVLNMLKPIDAAAVTAWISRASDLPDPNPPPDAPVTGDPALAGQTVACPYSDPFGRPTEISIVDHGGFILRCEAVARSETPSVRTLLSDGQEPNALEFQWQVNAMCSSMPAQLEFWGPWRHDDPREWTRPNFRLRVDIQEPDPGEPNACRPAISTQGVVLTLNVPVSAEEIIAFDTHGTTSTDSVETPEGRFEFSLGAGAFEYAADTPIDIAATLTYFGADPITIVGDSIIAFGFEQLDGNLGTTPLSILMCGKLDLHPGEPHVVPFRKNGGYSNDGPDAEFYRRYFQDPELKLPPGTYRISAGLGFNIGRDSCYDVEGYVGLRLSIVITVR